MRYNYLSNKDFLKIIDNLPNKTQYVKITVLSMAEDPIAAIEGYATSGSVSINGSSAVRRTGSVALVADDSFYNILEVENLISINKRIMLEVGIENTTPYYTNENIIWFPLGTFVIGSASISRNNQGLNISLSLKDKMALLSGDVGGTLSNAMVHSPISVELDDGTYAEEPVLFKDIIRTLVHEYGGIPLDKIIIDDIEERIKQAVRWVANYPIWLDEIGKVQNVPMYALTTQQPTGDSDWEYFEFGDNIGYINTDFVYPTESELSSNAGDSITSVLDKIKNTLGNYEYFFDLDGVFHFQAIKNYINEGSPEDNLEKAIEGTGMDYLVNTQEKSVYNFDDNILITAFQNSPQYGAIKNDINVWGIRGDSKAAIHYHLVIDDKPATPRSIYRGELYTDDFGVLRLKKGNKDIITSQDWRTEIYCQAVLNKDYSSPYAKELEENWPKIYDLANARFYVEAAAGTIDDGSVKRLLNNMPYFLDVISPAPLENLKVSKIGRRTKVLNDNNVNCLFNPSFPDYVYIESGQGEATKNDRAEALEKKQPFLQVPSSIYKTLAIGSALNSAYDAMRSVIHEMTSYNENISITSLPIYHLEPNTRITVNDEKSNIHGDYMIKSFSIPLAYNGTMTLQCTKAIERI